MRIIILRTVIRQTEVLIGRRQAGLSEEEMNVVCLDAFLLGYFRSHVSRCVIYGGQNSNGTGFYPSTSIISCQRYSISAPYSFVHLSPMLHNIRN